MICKFWKSYYSYNFLLQFAYSLICLLEMFAVRIMLTKALRALFIHCHSTLLIRLGAILNFQWMTAFAERPYTCPKWLPKMKALLTLILHGVHIKRNVFTLYQEEYFLIVQCLYGYVIVTLKLSCKDIPGSVISRAKESWFKCKKKMRVKGLA